MFLNSIISWYRTSLLREQQMKAMDIEAMYGLPTPQFYLFSLLFFFATIGIIALGFFFHSFFSLSPFIGFLALALLIPFLLRKSGIGRGFLWTFGRGRAPVQLMVGSWVMSFLIASFFTLFWLYS